MAYTVLRTVAGQNSSQLHKEILINHSPQSVHHVLYIPQFYTNCSGQLHAMN